MKGIKGFNVQCALELQAAEVHTETWVHKKSEIEYTTFIIKVVVQNTKCFMP